MNTNFKTAKKYSLSSMAGASLLLLGLALTGCSSNAPASEGQGAESIPSSTGAAEVSVDVDAPAITTEATTAAATTAAAKSSEKAEAKGRTVTMHVEGIRGEALVKALVVTVDGKETGGEMTSQSLPFDQEVTLPAGSTFNKVLVLGKYASGATGKISCSISIDGVNVASQTSSNHKPAECLFIEKN